MGAFLKNKRDQVSGCHGNAGEDLFERFGACLERTAPALLERLNGGAGGALHPGPAQTLWDTMKAPTAETAAGFSFGF